MKDSVDSKEAGVKRHAVQSYANHAAIVMADKKKELVRGHTEER